MVCPHCQKDIPDVEIARHLAAKGGRKSRNKLSSEKAREMAYKSAAKRRELKAQKESKS